MPTKVHDEKNVSINIAKISSDNKVGKLNQEEECVLCSF